MQDDNDDESIIVQEIGNIEKIKAIVLVTSILFLIGFLLILVFTGHVIVNRWMKDPVARFIYFSRTYSRYFIGGLLLSSCMSGLTLKEITIGKGWRILLYFLLGSSIFLLVGVDIVNLIWSSIYVHFI